MIIFLLFSFISGVVTILSPCIWPVMPILFSFSLAHPGKTRPLGISLGIIVSFTFLTLTLSLLVRSLGISPNIFRYLAVVVIVFFGLSLIYPPLFQQMEIFLGRFTGFAHKFKSQNSSTFFSGFITGLSLGALWTPCAGPILATIVTLAATGHVTVTAIYMALAYIIGVAIPLFAFTLGGQHLFSRLRFISSSTPKIQKVFGVIMIATSILILFNVDTQIQSILTNRIPQLNSSILNPDNNPIVRQQLNSLKGGQQLLSLSRSAPDFTGGTSWLNTGTPLTLVGLKGKVVLVDFWTYTCINCLRTLPHLTAWYEKYKNMGFVVIGVHTPEFEFEKNTSNVTKAISSFAISYPVVQDNNYVIWNNYQNQFWPAEYLIDSTGRLRRTSFGEGEYDQTEAAIQTLLTEAGHSINLPLDQHTNTAPTKSISPESYLGATRSQYYYPDSSLSLGIHNFTQVITPPLNSFTLGGSWTITGENAISGNNAVLSYHFLASKVFLVLLPGSETKSQINIYIDNKMTKQVTVDSDKLYPLFDNQNSPEDHIIKLEFLTPGTQAFAFTFG